MQFLQFGEECVSQRNTIFWGMAALQGPHGDHHLLITTSPGYEVRAHQSCCLSSRLVTTMPTCLQLPLQTDNYALLPEIPAEAAGIVSFYTFSNPAPGEYASMQLKWCPEVMLTAGGLQVTPLLRQQYKVLFETRPGCQCNAVPSGSGPSKAAADRRAARSTWASCDAPEAYKAVFGREDVYANL